MRKTPSPILAAVNATAKGLHRAGVMDEVTRRAFDGLCRLPGTARRRRSIDPKAAPVNQARPAAD